ncbi:hemolysin family protein [Rhodovulum sulfidophilum]|uniref:HlyC/CorC family transporter n=1 Tax=Rhodovulum sulfidophilum TaxID=35806 RepID=A0ABS1RT66_RHOSU|nr:hemolysin family protein [Rhodovulum sulfidophilum]MBL3573223.1 HlyC/CorC family transporter [Rhodovulum sulfidophilum]MBL3608722.1 HlyC/CorC family transporter [Rhodovulum sulfidophilum]MCE8430890.1 hemolysin family protein [Rhodovulum sulfidophilum]MCE8456547.1 hemolysin family protein [Rhodovulum sulfidophilum]MCF4115863.1 hemolysin family protein [Rhodovulum sulfidophilum]
MGDDTDGSSRAAQGALDTDNLDSRGLLGRLVAAILPAGAEHSEEGGDHALGNGIARPALTHGIGNLAKMRVEDVAVPKAEIDAVPLDVSMEDLVQVFRESGLTRLPVYDGTLDSPVGMVHLKDFALRHGFNGKDTPFVLKDMIRPLLYAPPSMPIGVLLQKMQSQRMHMALVIDEYGGVDGLVTIEDLIEQVVGEIEDEHDIDEGSLWIVEKPGVYLVQARAPLDAFEDEIGMRLLDAEEEEEVDSLGGLIFMMIGRVPARGEVIRHASGAEFEVVDADPRRIKRLRVRLPEATAAAAATA